MSKCVLDTSICVDLSNAGLLEIVLRLQHELLIPDVIADELKEPAGEHLFRLGFTAVGLGAEDMNVVTSYVERYREPSFADLFALACAKVHACVLLTGDAHLREAAKSEGVDVHGVLWVLDELVAQSILTPPDAATSLQRITAAGGWLPRMESEDRIKRWRG